MLSSLSESNRTLPAGSDSCILLKAWSRHVSSRTLIFAMSSSTFKLRVAALRPLLLVRRHNLNVRLVSRSIHSSSSSSHVPLLSRKLWTRAFFVAGVVGTSSVAYSTLCSPVHAESIPDLSDDTSSRRPTRSQPPLSSLVRAYVVYSLCSIPMLVDYSPSILSTLMAIPGISHISEFFIRHTFFAQVSIDIIVSQ